MTNHGGQVINGSETGDDQGRNGQGSVYIWQEVLVYLIWVRRYSDDNIREFLNIHVF